jgi:hypothetical protein
MPKFEPPDMQQRAMRPGYKGRSLKEARRHPNGKDKEEKADKRAKKGKK